MQWRARDGRFDSLSSIPMLSALRSESPLCFAWHQKKHRLLWNLFYPASSNLASDALTSPAFRLAVGISAAPRLASKKASPTLASVLSSIIQSGICCSDIWHLLLSALRSESPLCFAWHQKKHLLLWHLFYPASSNLASDALTSGISCFPPCGRNLRCASPGI